MRGAKGDDDVDTAMYGSKALNRFLTLIVMVCCMGCTVEQWPPAKMYSPVNVPKEGSNIHPWIAGLLDADVEGVRKRLADRMECDIPALEPLIQSMDDFVPVQVVFSSNDGYLRCVRRFADSTTRQPVYEAIYISQPLPDDVVETRVAYFDRDVQPLAREFIKRFAGSGEEMEGTAGQFSLRHWVDATEFNWSEEISLGEWGNSKSFYAALNGDSVFIRPNGATAWLVLETGKVVPIAETLAEFVQLYAGFRATHGVFDSWSCRDFQLAQKKR